ncbi:MAG TPA: AraC family transcriptional regulator [Verrucomicrobiae bacterium]|nr:AraC family transcriptional regulator [Verrucomicrobiae bacterium]
MDTTLILIQGGHSLCTRANWHGNHEWSEVAKLYAPASGAGWVAVDGRMMRLRPGRLYLIPPHHRLDFGTDRRLVVNWLHFMPLSPLLDASLAALNDVWCSPAELATRWQPVTSALGVFFHAATPAGTCQVQALVLEIVARLLEQMPATQPSSARLRPAIRFMDDHVTTPPPLAEIARAVGLSPEYFHRLFRRQFHTTPFEYLLRRRLAKAHRLLAEGTLSVKEVAAACGYDDPYYFSRLFRQRYHGAPRDVRSGKVHPMP